MHPTAKLVHFCLILYWHVKYELKQYKTRLRDSLVQAARADDADDNVYTLISKAVSLPTSCLVTFQVLNGQKAFI